MSLFTNTFSAFIVRCAITHRLVGWPVVGGRRNDNWLPTAARCTGSFYLTAPTQRQHKIFTLALILKMQWVHLLWVIGHKTNLQHNTVVYSNAKRWRLILGNNLGQHWWRRRQQQQQPRTVLGQSDDVIPWWWKLCAVVGGSFNLFNVM